MTGPEHFAAAEKALDCMRWTRTNDDNTNPAAALLLAEAQVHATLALAAATAQAGTIIDGSRSAEQQPWRTAGAF